MGAELVAAPSASSTEDPGTGAIRRFRLPDSHLVHAVKPSKTRFIASFEIERGMTGRHADDRDEACQLDGLRGRGPMAGSD